MGRSITFNLLEGTGTVQAPAHGWLSIRPTKEHITGSMVVLATEDERRINSQGVVTFPDVQPTPDEDPNTGKYPWAYIVKYRNITGYETSWTVLVPVGTTPLQGSQLIQVVPDDVHYTIMQGPAGEKGDGIHVYGAYPTVSAMEAANPLPKRGDSYLIGSKLYVWDGATWGNSSDLQGAKGDKGDKGIQGQQGATGLKGDTGLTGATPAITTVANTGEPGSATAVVKSGTNVAPVLTFTIPRGDKGETGAQGLKGDKGDTGDQGTPGQGVPTADGSNGDVITYSDGQTLWVDPNTLIPAATEQQSGLMTAADKAALGQSVTPSALGAAIDEVRTTAVFNVKSFGAVGDGVTDDGASVAAALQAAASLAQSATVLFPKGSYFWNTPVRVFSNTTVLGDSAILTKPTAGGYAMFFHISSEDAKGYASGARNVTFRGLRVEGNFSVGKQAGLVAANHASNLLVEDCDFYQCHSRGHILDLQGCEDVTVRRCTFAGQLLDTNYPYSECIQLDNSSKMGVSYDDGFTGYDGLPSRRVTVERCRFIPLTVGGTTYRAPNPMGSHYGFQGMWQEDINFIDNEVFAGHPDSASFVRGSLHFMSARRVRILRNRFIGDANSALRAISFQAQDSGPTPATAGQSSPTVVTFTEKQQCVDLWITDNHFSGYAQGSTTESLILVSGGYGGFSERVTVDGNIFVDNFTGNLAANLGPNPIDLRSVKNAVVTRNSIRNARRILSASACQNVRVDGNVSSGTSIAVAIFLTGCTGVSVSGNVLQSYAGGIAVESSTDATVVGNQFTGEVTAGSYKSIGLKSVSRFTVTGNSAYSTSTISNGILVESASTKGVISGNVMLGMKAPVSVSADSAVTQANNVTA